MRVCVYVFVGDRREGEVCVYVAKELIYNESSIMAIIHNIYFIPVFIMFPQSAQSI